MNERIKELTEQAKEISHWLDGGYTPVWRINPEKFAELVIEEAFSVMARQMFLHCDTQASDPGYMKAVANTKKKFGL